MTLGKIINGKVFIASYGGRVVIDGIKYYNPTEQTYRNLGFIEIEQPKTKQNYHLQYHAIDGQIVVKSVKNIQNPLVQQVFYYDKLKIISELKKLKKWQDVKSYIKELDLYDEFLLVLELKSDLQNFNEIINKFKQKFKDIDVDKILKDALL